MSPADRPHVDQILKELRAHDYRLRDLVHLVVLSEPFKK
ncbi:MAG: DUF1585 domain-containing protein [Planctomycetaceae bacterium]|nr:DUF1585 domain-containing protein [Planctomycetaceae bacterium]MBT6487036.1 DUF1585 domain-containing protein [Planctomycetaceae bacterium]MBT6496208.1 DUF1585 domain-containing protein [Planctomycetaceae bacterium]